MSGYIQEFTRGKKVFFEIVFPEVPKGVMHDLRSLLKNTGGRVCRNSEGGITIIPVDQCCPEIVSDLAFSIGETIPELTVDAETIPVHPNLLYK